MTTKLLWIATGFLLLAGLICTGMGWHGTFKVTAGAPLSNTAVEFCGSATGAWALAGIVCTISAVVLFIVSLIRTMVASAGGGPPPSQPE